MTECDNSYSDLIGQFLDQIDTLLELTTPLLVREDLSDELNYVGKTVVDWLDQVHEEIQKLRTEFDADDQSRAKANEALNISGSVRLIEAQIAVTTAAASPENKGISLCKAFDLGKAGLDKITLYIPDGIIKKLLADAGILLPQLKCLINQAVDKLDALTFDVAEVEAKIERLIHQLLGNPLKKNKGEKGAKAIPPITEGPAEPALSGSMLWFLWDIERKLEYLWKRINGGGYPRPGQGKLITPPADDHINRGEPIGKEIDDICFKLECLAKLLGKTLYNAEWSCDPDPTRVSTPAPPDGQWLHPLNGDGHRGWDATPPKSIKDEIHAVEECLNEMKACLEEIKKCLKVLKEPPECPPHPPLPVDLKRIFVYAEGIFEPGSSTDIKIVDIHTGAFDLAGWVDLTDLEDGDSVSIALFVHLPGSVKRLYKERTYVGKTSAGLKSIQDVVGATYIVGSHVEVVIQQTTSGSGFANTLKIAYQFVVESQRQP